MDEISHTGLETAVASDTYGMYLTFWIDGQLFGIPISVVMQIVGVQPITQIPEFPHYAKGIINLRGAIIPVVDVRLRLNKMEAEYNDRTCIIVVSSRDKQYGLIVDEVEEVANISDESIAQPPQMSVSGMLDQFLTGIAQDENHVRLLVDPIRLVGMEWNADICQSAEF